MLYYIYVLVSIHTYIYIHCVFQFLFFKMDTGMSHEVSKWSVAHLLSWRTFRGVGYFAPLHI